MTRCITLLVHGKARYYGQASTSDTAVWVLERERARVFVHQDAQATLKWLQTTYRLPGVPQIKVFDAP